jgi:8-oxo-dGTP pyrophosphatase MutT (NUDIX family)
MRAGGAFDLPRGRLFEVARAELSVEDAPHPYETANSRAIDENWRREQTANPALFDGRILLFSRLVWRDGLLSGICHAARYASFMHWRQERAPEAEHLFAHAMPVSRDGALIAIRMGGHTVNAGRIYFAAGSFEPEDVREGAIDVALNMRREVAEETGLDLASCACDETYHAYSHERATVIVRRYFLAETADAIAARIRAFVAADPAPEVEAPVVIRAASDLPDGLMPHMRPLIEWHFNGKAKGER